MSRSSGRSEAIRTVARDAVSMIVGAFIAINEELSGHVHPELLILAALFVGGPSVAALYSLSRSLGKTAIPDTPESSESSQRG